MFPYGFCSQPAVFTGFILSGIFGLLMIVYGGLLLRGLQYNLNSWYDLAEVNKDLPFASVEDFTDMQIENVLDGRAGLLLFAGIVIFGYTGLGIQAVNKGSLKMLLWAGLIILLSMTWNLIIFAQFYDETSGIHMSAKRTLVNNLRKVFETEDTKEQKYWNTLMVMGECCGIRGAGDFMFNPGAMNSSGHDWLQGNNPPLYPPACCKGTLLKQGQYEVDCYYTAYPDEIFQKLNLQGCYSAMPSVFGSSFVYLVVFGVFIIAQFIQIFLCSILYFVVKYSAEQADQQSLQIEEDDEEEQADYNESQDDKIEEKESENPVSAKSYQSNESKPMSAGSSRGSS